MSNQEIGMFGKAKKRNNLQNRDIEKPQEEYQPVKNIKKSIVIPAEVYYRFNAVLEQSEVAYSYELMDLLIDNYLQHTDEINEDLMALSINKMKKIDAKKRQ
ncbi:hypothetical protein R4Y45_06850 [Holzapfeliella sp. He02]|uniref:Replication-associated protein n=1 Tax=Holzapfeliella saturejae TaxID=3082953 RepID=A0ABU8SHS0_9LACO